GVFQPAERIGKDRGQAEIRGVVILFDDGESVALQQRGAGGVAEREKERLVILQDRIAAHGHVHRLRRLAGREGQRSRRRVVVLSGASGAVGGGVIDTDVLRRRRRKRDRE